MGVSTYETNKAEKKGDSESEERLSFQKPVVNEDLVERMTF